MSRPLQKPGTVPGPELSAGDPEGHDTEVLVGSKKTVHEEYCVPPQHPAGENNILVHPYFHFFLYTLLHSILIDLLILASII